MKRKTAVLTIGILAATSGWAQTVINNTRSQLNAVQQKQAVASNAALAATQGQNAKPSPAPAPATAAKPAAAASTAKAPATQPGPAKAKGVAVIAVKPAAAPAKPQAKAPVKAEAKVAPVAAPKPAEAALAVAVEDKTNPADPKKDEPINMAGHRDPFISPVVNHTGGSGCSTGKKCLAIDQIALRGVIKSDTGMIAIVVNALDKAYFLRENDPVFNGYVVKITGDSIVFKESFEDKLGKPLTREVTKRIATPAV